MEGVGELSVPFQHSSPHQFADFGIVFWFDHVQPPAGGVLYGFVPAGGGKSDVNGGTQSSETQRELLLLAVGLVDTDQIILVLDQASLLTDQIILVLDHACPPVQFRPTDQIMRVTDQIILVLVHEAT